MKSQLKALLGMSLFAAIVAAPQLDATVYTIYIHGKGGTQCGDSTTNAVATSDVYGKFTDTDAYGAANKSRTTNTKIFVNYNGATNPRSSGSCRAQTSLSSAINSYCQGTNSCRIICHSAGCLATDYWIYANSASARNISWVVFAGSAAGGSPLATYGDALWPQDAMTDALKVANARNFNHNVGPYTRYQVAGYNGGAFSAFLNGQDDNLVNYHSACGYNSTSGNGTMTHCNDGNNGKWSYHSTYCNTSWTTTYLRCNTSNYGYNAGHSPMKPIGRNAHDWLSGSRF